MNTRIPDTIVSAILIFGALGLRNRLHDPYVYVVNCTPSSVHVPEADGSGFLDARESPVAGEAAAQYRKCSRTTARERLRIQDIMQWL